MSPERSKNPIVAKLDAAGAELGMSRQAISVAAGLDRGFLQKLHERGATASVRTANLIKLADAAQVPREDLLALTTISLTTSRAPTPKPAPATQEIPILGAAEGSVVGSFIVQNDPIGYVARPPGLAHVSDAYALYVRNDSMVPAHPPGELRFVHPHKPPRSGDTIIIQIARPTGEVEAYIKIYTKRSDGWIVCQQLNPQAEIKFSLATIKHIHKVMTTAELFNA